MRLRLYTSAPPRFWPFVVVKPGSRVPGWPMKSVIVDNGAFGYYMSGSFPPPEKWVSQLLRAAWLASTRSDETIVVLPDMPLSPASNSLLAKRAAKALCRDYRCMYVLHWLGDYQAHGPDFFLAQMLDVEADLYAVPLKLPTSRAYSGRKRSVLADEKTQLAVVYDAAEAAKQLGVGLHLLAPSTRLVRLLPLLSMSSIESIDTTAWTRASSQELKRKLGTISARSERERQLFFIHYAERLAESGIAVEYLETYKSRFSVEGKTRR